jgi:hypothetical protein
MPIRKVKGGYKWGGHGKVYSNRAGAARQAAAAYANGYKGDAAKTASDRHSAKHVLGQNDSTYHNK